jgi:hypothetical protein
MGHVFFCVRVHPHVHIYVHVHVHAHVLVLILPWLFFIGVDRDLYRW